MMKRARYQPPPAPFAPGDRVRYQRQTYTVIASTHTHTQLEGFKYAVPNWEIQKTKAKRIPRRDEPRTA